MLFDIFDHAGRVSKTAWKWKGSGSYIYIYSLQNSKLVNYNGTNIVDVGNANKITDARTKMEVGKLRTRVTK